LTMTTLATVATGALDFFARHQSVAPWVQTVGSLVGLLAAYSFGSREKTTRKRAFALTAWTMTRNTHRSLGECVNGVLSDDRHDGKEIDRLYTNLNFLTKATEKLLDFPSQELNNSPLLEFSDYRQTIENITDTLIYITSDVTKTPSSSQIDSLVAECSKVDLHFYKFRVSLGPINKRMIERDPFGEDQIYIFWTPILKARESTLTSIPGSPAEAAHVRRMLKRSEARSIDLRRRTHASHGSGPAPLTSSSS